jgi:hypothetical protein
MNTDPYIGPDGQPTQHARDIEAHFDAEIQRLDQQIARLRRRRERALLLAVADQLEKPQPNPVHQPETE